MPRVWVLGALGLGLTVPLAGNSLFSQASSQVRPPTAQPVTQPVGQATGQPPGRGATPTSPSEQDRGPGNRQGRTEWEWWKDPAVKKELGLTEQKARDLDRIFQDRLRAIKPFADEYWTQLEELSRMAAERKVDEAVFALQVSRVEVLRSRLNESRTIMFYRMHRKLTDEQVKKLREIREARDRNRSGRGGGSR